MVTGAFAAVGQLYVTPAVTTIQQNENFTVSLRLTPGIAVDGIEATMKYDPAVLQFVSVDGTGSPFDTEIQSMGGAGTVKIARGTFSAAIITDSLVANVTFKALTVSSQTSVSITGNATSAGQTTDPVAVSAVVSVFSPVPPPPAEDKTPPEVTITNPAYGAYPRRSTFKIRANATDNTAVVKKMEVYIDGSIRQTSTSGYISFDWSVKSRRIAKGAHTVTVKAYDGSGNVGTKSIKIYK